MIRARAACVACLLVLIGCINTPKPTVQRSLVDVVDALQFAVEEVGRDGVWKASEQEQAHWNEACKQARETASRNCVLMLAEADKVCRSLCASGSCGFPSQELCRKAAAGEDRVGLCAGPFKGSPWCGAAMTCAVQTQARDSTCQAAASISSPQLKEATVTLATEEASETNAKVKLMVVAFGGGAGRTATNAVKLQLLPRVRSKDYNSDVLPKVPGEKVMSPEAQAFAAELKALLASAVAAVVKEDDATTGVVARPPMALGAFDIEVALTLTSSGKLGIEKAWSTPAAGVELGTSASAKTSNVLKVSFARKQ
jgi:hypothetical protein